MTNGFKNAQITSAVVLVATLPLWWWLTRGRPGEVAPTRAHTG